MNTRQTATLAGLVIGKQRDIYQFASTSKTEPKMFAGVARPDLNFCWSGKEPFAPSAPVPASSQVATHHLPADWERWALNQSMLVSMRQRLQQQQKYQQIQQNLFQMAGQTQGFLDLMELKHGDEQDSSRPHVPDPRRGFDNVKDEPDCWVCLIEFLCSLKSKQQTRSGRQPYTNHLCCT